MRANRPPLPARPARAQPPGEFGAVPRTRAAGCVARPSPRSEARPEQAPACGILETCSSDLRTRSQIGELLPPLRRKDRMIRSCPKPPAWTGSNFENHIFTLLEHIRGPDGDESSVSVQ